MSIFNSTAPVQTSLQNTNKICHVYPFTPSMEAQVKTGYRNVVVRWKATKDKITGGVIPAPAARIVSVPLFELVISKECAALQGMLQDAYNAQVDALVRSFLEREMVSNYNLQSFGIPELSLSFDEVLKFYEAQNSDGRGAGKLSSKMIGDWFSGNSSDSKNGNMASSLAGVFLEKSGRSENDLTVEDIQKLETAVERYKEQFMRLAAPKVTLKGGILDQLEKALQITPQDAMSGRLLGVISKARSVKDDIELEDL